MQFSVLLTEDVMLNHALYREYSSFLYKKIKEDIKKSSYKNSKKYQIREKYILSTNLIKWKHTPPAKINLLYYINNCLELKKSKGLYVIRVRTSDKIGSSRTLVNKLIRILEYGTDKIPALPIVIPVLRYYSTNYQNMFYEFLMDKFHIE